MMCSFSWCSGSSRGRTTGPPIRRCLPALGTTGGHPSYVPTDPSLAAGPPTRVEPRRKGFPKNSHPAYPAGVVPGRQGKENTPRQGGRGRQAGRQPTTPLQERTPKNKPTRQEERRERGEEEEKPNPARGGVTAQCPVWLTRQDLGGGRGEPRSTTEPSRSPRPAYPAALRWEAGMRLPAPPTPFKPPGNRVIQWESVYSQI